MQKGRLVVVWRDNGEALLTRTRSEVEKERGRSTIFVEGIAGCYALDAVREVTIHPSAALCEDLENWAGRALEFLDNFEGSFEDDAIANEGLALQEEGLKMGLVRIYPPQKEEKES